MTENNTSNKTIIKHYSNETYLKSIHYRPRVDDILDEPSVAANPASK